jgi:hypothetical protein
MVRCLTCNGLAYPLRGQYHNNPRAPAKRVTVNEAEALETAPPLFFGCVLPAALPAAPTSAHHARLRLRRRGNPVETMQEAIRRLVAHDAQDFGAAVIEEDDARRPEELETLQ